MAEAADHRQLMRAAIEHDGDGQRALLEGDHAAAREAFAAAAELYRQSWEAAPPASYGRLVGMLKSAILAGGGQSQADYVLTALADDWETSPTASYARAVAALVQRDDTEAKQRAEGMRAGSEAFARTADAIAALAERDEDAYGRALREIVADFENRDQLLTNVPVADTALMLERLADRRGISASVQSPLLPRCRAETALVTPRPARQNRSVTDARAHWQQIYRAREPETLSWYEPAPEISLSLIEDAALAEGAAILDVGGGASKLAGRLLASGYSDVTVVDIASTALERARAELGPAAAEVKWIEADVRAYEFKRRFDLWHDRGLLHFMVTPGDRERYLEGLRRTLRPGGHLILATFGPQGPTRCSGRRVDRYGAAELSDLLGRDFELLASRLEQHRTPGGRVQQLLYAHFRRERDGEAQSTK